MRIRALIAIAGWIGFVVSCGETLGSDEPAGAGGTGGGGADCPPGAWYDATYEWCVPEWANWPVPVVSPGAAAYTWTDDTVTDQVTGLMWQRHRDLQACGKAVCPWKEAHEYCHALDLGGFQDWRLPSIIELVSLLDFSVEVYLDQTAFPGESNRGWSASCVAPNPSGSAASGCAVADPKPWYINSDGEVERAFWVYSEEFVRCVR